MEAKGSSVCGGLEMEMALAGSGEGNGGKTEIAERG